MSEEYTVTNYTIDDAVEKFKKFVMGCADLISENPIFTTNVDVESVFKGALKKADSTLSAEPYLSRRWNCSACRYFLRRVGSVVLISEQGTISSPIWSRPYPTLGSNKGAEIEEKKAKDASLSTELNPEKANTDNNFGDLHPLDVPYAFIAKELNTAVTKGTVTGLFTTDITDIGETKINHFSHMRFTLARKNKSHILDCSPSSRKAQVAEYRSQIYKVITNFNEDKNLKTTLIDLIEELGKSDREFIRPISHGKWVLNVICEFNNLTSDDERNNYVWRQATLSPYGYPNFNSSLLNASLEIAYDESENRSLSERISKAVAFLRRELHPSRYQTETRPMTEDRLLEAAKAFRETGAESAIQQRAITVEDIQEFVWRPSSENTTKLTQDELSAIAEAAPLEDVSVDEFVDEILPKAECMWLSVDPTSSSLNLSIFACAANPTSVALVNWDAEDPEDRFKKEKRNTVCWGVYNFSRPFATEQYSERFNTVAGITKNPSHWHGRQSVTCNFKVLLVEGYKAGTAGGLLFKSYINNRFRAYAGTIEEVSRNTKIIDSESNRFTHSLHPTQDENKEEGEVWEKQLKGYSLRGYMEEGTSILVKLKGDENGTQKYAQYVVHNKKG